MTRPSVAILVGGLATRLGALASATPKCLLDVSGRPFIHHQLALLRKQGIARVVLCIGHLGEQVVEAVGDGSMFGVKVVYSCDGHEPKGTAGAVKRALPLLSNPFFVLYGDSYLNCDYQDVERTYEAARTLALMTVFRNDGQWDTSNVEFQHGKIVTYDKLRPSTGCGTSITASDSSTTAPSSWLTIPAPGTWRRCIRVCSPRVNSPGTRSLSVFMRLDRSPGSKRQGNSLLSGGDLRGSTPGAVMSHAARFLAEARQILDGLDVEAIERMAALVKEARDRAGRLFILGVGGSAANASHAVNDFRKIVGIEAYAPTDNVSELTARTNDEGWATIFVEWLKVSRLTADDLILVLSVGGGNLEKNVSPNLVSALDYARQIGTPVIGIVGKDGGHTARVATACAIIPTVNPDHITPHSEAFQGVVWHLLVSHPDLKVRQTRWEAIR